MLDFFRRYQRYIFLVVTVVIIISFSFFGTYSTLGSNTWREQVAFKAINGQEINRSDLDELVVFLATDNEDKMLYGGLWGPNFLNDGVIRKDFLETGLAQELAFAYQEELQEDLEKRLFKEKKYNLYTHPQAKFLGVENVWNYFAPQMKMHFDSLRSSKNSLDPQAFDSRVKLYLAEKQFPASTLRYILRYQEQQYNWLKPDEKLNQIDLSLFGYHSLEDWFSSNFVRLISEFIINAAILAEEQGYKVSNAEVLSDLIRNTQVSYQQNQSSPHLGVTSPEEYFSEQLRRLNMDQARAIKVWRQVLLFRRYFHDAGSTALVDALMNQQLHQFAHENVTIDLYRLPTEFRLANYDDFQKFEVYLQAVTKPSANASQHYDLLSLPQQFLADSEVTKNYPELVQKRYELEVAQVNQKALQARIGLRELWNWEIDDQNWKVLKKQFPDLGLKGEDTRERHFEALENLDSMTRSLVDAFAKQAIIKNHPEWIDQALQEAKVQKMIVGLRAQGGRMPFSGLDQQDKRQALMRLLDQAPLGIQVAPDSPLYAYSADDQVYYRIAVLDRVTKPEVLTFAEASSDGTLDQLRDRVLEKYYLKVREQSPYLYQKEGKDKEWQTFAAVKDLVANQFFEKTLLALESVQKALPPDNQQKSWSKDQIATLRFYSYLQEIQEELKNNPEKAKQWIRVSEETSLAQIPSLADQWKIEKVTLKMSRQGQDQNNPIDIEEAFALNPEVWSSIKVPVNGDLAFFQVKSQGSDSSQELAVAQQIRQAQSLLGAEAQRHLMRQVLQTLKEKNALSLAYLKIPLEENSIEENNGI